MTLTPSADQHPRRLYNPPVRRPLEHRSGLFVRLCFGQSSEHHFASERLAEQLDLWERCSVGRHRRSRADLAHGALAGLGSHGAARRTLSMRRSSWSPNFGENRFHELRRCRSKLHTRQGRKSKVRISEPSRGSDTPLTMALKSPRFLCRPSATLSRAPERRLECSCSRGADSRRPKGPNRADIGSNRLLYTSRSGRPGFLYQSGGVNS